jgi:CheY-like chemotaxis protein
MTIQRTSLLVCITTIIFVVLAVLSLFSPGQIPGLILYASLGAILIISIISYINTGFNIIKPLSLVCQALQKVEENEKIDLGKRVDVISKNEIGNVVDSFNHSIETTGDLVRKIKNKLDALTNTSFEITTDLSKTSIAVKRLSMNLTNIKLLITRQETEATEADIAVDSIKTNIENKKVSLSTLETLLKHTEDFIDTSRETVNCLNEIVERVNSVNKAVNSVNNMSKENNRNFDELKVEMEKFAIAKGSKQILLVDDDEIHLDITEAMLTDDFEVIKAKSGEEALDLFYHGLVPTIILLDLIMPDMDGWDTYERIKAIGALHEVPIAFFSSSFDIEDIKRAFDIGVNEYIPKPVEKEELMKAVDKMLKSVPAKNVR